MGEEVDSMHYKSIVEKYLHLTYIRPDIQFATGMVGRFVAQ